MALGLSRIDTNPQCNSSTYPPPAITENGKIDLGLIGFAIRYDFTAYCQQQIENDTYVN